MFEFPALTTVVVHVGWGLSMLEVSVHSVFAEDVFVDAVRLTTLVVYFHWPLRCPDDRVENLAVGVVFADMVFAVVVSIVRMSLTVGFVHSLLVEYRIPRLR